METEMAMETEMEMVVGLLLLQQIAAKKFIYMHNIISVHRVY